MMDPVFFFMTGLKKSSLNVMKVLNTLLEAIL